MNKEQIRQTIGSLYNGRIGIVLRFLYPILSFGILDAWLRVLTRHIRAYSIWELAPNLFTVLWAVLFTAAITLIPSRRIARIVYGVVYYFYAIYAVVQYGSYLVLGKFLYVSDFFLASEGGAYASWVAGFITPSLIVQIVALLAVGVIGILLFPPKPASIKRRLTTNLIAVAVCVIGITQVPRLYGDANEQAQTGRNPAFEYQSFTNANFDLELTGLYQYLARDISIQIGRNFQDTDAIVETIDAFFAEKTEHAENDMTGLLEGKNVIVVMMESIDDWVITAEDTPTLYKMMGNSIQFTNLYTPQYSNGYTFNTEFAFNTGVYPYSNGNVAYTLLRNQFSNSIANRFAAAGYTANSYHEGEATYYNRGEIHHVLGYTKYHSYTDYTDQRVEVYDDRFLINTDTLYQDVVSGEPFFSFVISYSAHLPYTDDDWLAKHALAAYPQYDLQEDREINILRAKARLTDDMFAGLLERLEADGLLQDTVIVGYGDHYTYGLSDEDLEKIAAQTGNPIWENTPAFVYYTSFDTPVTVNKTMQITDLTPTLLNLFGLDVPKEIMGQDVFDENYTGFAIFPDNTWLTDTTYVKNGQLEWNNGMTDEEIAAMNAYVQQVYRVNDAILDVDYYRQKAE